MNIFNFCIKEYILKNAKIYILFILIGCITSILSVYEQVYILKLFINEVSIQTIVLILVSTSLTGIRIWLNRYISNKLYINTMEFFFNKVCLQKLEEWEKYDKIEMIKIVNNDIQNFVDVFSKVINILIKNTIAIIIICNLLYRENILYLLFGIIMCTSRSIFVEKLAKKWEKQLEKLKDKKTTIENKIIEYINNNEQMQIYGLNNVYSLDLTINSIEYDSIQKDESLFLAIFMFTFFNLTKFIDIGLYITISIGGIYSTLYNSQILLSYYRLLSDYVQHIADLQKAYNQNKDSIKRLSKYLKNIKERNYKYEKFESAVEQIVFKNVKFKYKTGEKYILNDYNKVIKKNEKLVLLGESGKGKTTMIKLLLGLYTPNDGYIFINDKEVSMMNQFDIKRYISVVPQESIILENKTIRENIELFIGKKEDLLMEQVLSRVELNYKLNDKVVNLSGGQKRRLALARAILDKKSVIVLDEPFTGLDIKLKAKMYKLLEEEFKDNIVILITHDRPIPDGFSIM
jgi:ATP-binding cassette subfamily B protein